MNRLSKFFIASIVFAASFDSSAWRFRKPVALTPGDGLAVVKVDRDMYIGSSTNLSDLRVLKDGEETPFILVGAFAAVSSHATPEMIDKAIVGGAGLRFTLHTGPRERHNAVTISTSEQNFRQTVKIEASQDNAHWTLLRNDGAIFDFSQDGRQISSLSVNFPVSTRPYIRVTVLGWTKLDMVSGAGLDYATHATVGREILATLTPSVTEDAKSQTTILTMDAGVKGLPVDRLLFSATTPSFHRAVGVETSDDNSTWTYESQSVISRLPGADATEEQLTIPVQTTHRYLRLRIYNRDDKPIQTGAVQLEGITRYIKFLAAAPGQYWVYYGNANASSPVYDLPVVLSRREKMTESSWTAGAQQTNPAYKPPPEPKKPWSEQHPAILYTVLGVAVVGLAIATIRFASRLRPQS
jgi:hypothetical protein